MRPALRLTVFLIALFCLSACASTPATRVVKVPAHSPSPLRTEQAGANRFFETGIAVPDFSRTGYSSFSYENELLAVNTATAADWVEIPILFTQSSPTSTDVRAGSKTPSVAAVVSAIQHAHAMGYKVFLVPLDSLWVGYVRPARPLMQSAWFTNYWYAYEPYIIAAEQNGVEQLAIASEATWLQDHAMPALWNNLIAQIHSFYHGVLTYDMNWVPTVPTLPSWMKNPLLSSIGFSEYMPLAAEGEVVSLNDIPARWQHTVKPIIDGIAKQVRKPIILSEVGYRATSDALSSPWLTTSTAPADPAMQAAASAAAIQSALDDPYIQGIFFWAWSNAQAMTLTTEAKASIAFWYKRARASARVVAAIPDVDAVGNPSRQTPQRPQHLSTEQRLAAKRAEPREVIPKG